MPSYRVFFEHPAGQETGTFDAPTPILAAMRLRESLKFRGNFTGASNLLEPGNHTDPDPVRARLTLHAFTPTGSRDYTVTVYEIQGKSPP